MDDPIYIYTIKPKFCKYCGSDHINKSSYNIGKNGVRKQSFQCKKCGKRFYGLNSQEVE
jgi:transposase-like protein